MGADAGFFKELRPGPFSRCALAPVVSLTAFCHMI